MKDIVLFDMADYNADYAGYKIGKNSLGKLVIKSFKTNKNGVFLCPNASDGYCLSVKGYQDYMNVSMLDYIYTNLSTRAAKAKGSEEPKEKVKLYDLFSESDGVVLSNASMQDIAEYMDEYSDDEFVIVEAGHRAKLVKNLSVEV